MSEAALRFAAAHRGATARTLARLAPLIEAASAVAGRLARFRAGCVAGSVTPGAVGVRGGRVPGVDGTWRFRRGVSVGGFDRWASGR